MNITRRLQLMEKKQWKKRLIYRMKTNNPMFNPETVNKVSEKLKGNQNARKDHNPEKNSQDQTASK